MLFGTSALATIFSGFLVTLEITAISVCGALAIGLIIGLCRMAPIRSLRTFGKNYIEIIRSIPVVVILVFLFFAGPSFGLVFSPIQASIAGLSVYMACYVAEALRSGVNTIPAGQFDAARALGFPYTDILKIVVIPQATRSVIPALGNVIIDLSKNTSVAYTIAAVELTGAATNMATKTAEPYVFFFSAIVLYLLMTLSLGFGFRMLERKLEIKR